MSSIHDEVICDSCILCELSGGALPAAYPHNESYALIVHSLHRKPGNKEAKLGVLSSLPQLQNAAQVTLLCLGLSDMFMFSP
jgi:hypothetical protein